MFEHTHTSLSWQSRIPVCLTWPWMWQTVLAVSILGIQARRTGGQRRGLCQGGGGRWTEEGRGKKLPKTISNFKSNCEKRRHACTPKGSQRLFKIFSNSFKTINVSSVDVRVQAITGVFVSGYLCAHVSFSGGSLPACSIGCLNIEHSSGGPLWVGHAHMHTFTHFQTRSNILSSPHRRSVRMLCHKSELSNRFYSS